MQVERTRKRPPRDPAEFWVVASEMSQRDRKWMPSGGYELRHKIEVDGDRWTVCLKIHVVSELEDQLENWAGVRFLATVTLWPPKLADRDTKRAPRLGWYRALKEELARRGYRGGWSETPGVGHWANFEKALSTASEVRREATHLERLRFLPAGETATTRRRASR